MAKQIMDRPGYRDFLGKEIAFTCGFFFCILFHYGNEMGRAHACRYDVCARHHRAAQKNSIYLGDGARHPAAGSRGATARRNSTRHPPDFLIEATYTTQRGRYVRQHTAPEA